MRWNFAALVVCFTCVTAFGGYAPPDPPGTNPPPAVFPNVPIPEHVAPHPTPDPAGPMTRERFNRLVLSAPLRAESQRPLNAGVQAVTGNGSTKGRHFRAEPATATVPSTFAITADGGSAYTDDYEPTIISQLNGNGTFATMHTVIVEHRFPNGDARAHLMSFHTTATPPTGATDFSGPTGLTIPTGYTRAGDPYLSQNPYNTGVQPLRIYCVGLLWNDDYFANPSAVAVWHSDDHGVSWSTPSIVASISGGGHVLDKPMISVSQYSGTRGYAYVTYVNVDSSNTSNNAITVRKSTDGGSTWSDERAPVVTAFVHYPTVVTNPFNATVYAIWRTFGTGGSGGTIDMLSSANWAAPAAETVASTGLLDKDTNIGSRVVANTIPMARYNPTANELAVVYAARDSNNHTDVYYVHRPSGTWSSPIQVNDNTTATQNSDQFMPALDYTSAGNIIVAYYDRRDDVSNNVYNNIRYREYYTYLTSSGAHVNSQADFAASPAGMDPSIMSWYGQGVGDYQDVWDDNYYLETERASSAWIGAVTSLRSDLFFSRVTY
jgi:hypothetical protein